MELDELLKAAADGNIESLQTLYEELRVPVYAVAFAIVGNRAAAEDVLQETFVRIYEKAGSYRPGTHPKAWVTSIARHLAYDALRQRQNHAVFDAEVDRISDPKTNIPALRLELMEALFQLSDIERQIVVMHVIGGLKHREIGVLLGMPAGTVRWKYRKSLAQLARFMGGEEDGARSSYFPVER